MENTDTAVPSGQVTVAPPGPKEIFPPPASERSAAATGDPQLQVAGPVSSKFHDGTLNTHGRSRVDGDTAGAREGLLAHLDLEVVRGRFDEGELTGGLEVVLSSREGHLVGVTVRAGTGALTTTFPASGVGAHLESVTGLDEGGGGESVAEKFTQGFGRLRRARARLAPKLLGQ